MDEKVLLKLWEDGKEYFDLPDFETFKVDMQDEAKFNTFKNDISQFTEPTQPMDPLTQQIMLPDDPITKQTMFWDDPRLSAEQKELARQKFDTDYWGEDEQPGYDRPYDEKELTLLQHQAYEEQGDKLEEKLEEYKRNFSLKQFPTEDVELEETPTIDYLKDITEKYNKSESFLEQTIGGVAGFLTEERPGMDFSIAKGIDIGAKEIENFEETSIKLLEKYYYPEIAAEDPTIYSGRLADIPIHEQTDKQIEAAKEIEENSKKLWAKGEYKKMWDEEDPTSLLKKIVGPLLQNPNLSPEDIAKFAEQTGLEPDEAIKYLQQYDVLNIAKESARLHDRQMDYHKGLYENLMGKPYGNKKVPEYYQEYGKYIDNLENLDMSDPDWREKMWEDDIKDEIFSDLHFYLETEEEFKKTWEPFLNSWGLNIYATAGDRVSFDRMRNAVTITGGPENLVIYTKNHEGAAKANASLLFDYVKKYGKFMPAMTAKELNESTLSAYAKNLIDKDWIKYLAKDSDKLLKINNDGIANFNKVVEDFKKQMPEENEAFIKDLQERMNQPGPISITEEQALEELQNFAKKQNDEAVVMEAWMDHQGSQLNNIGANYNIIKDNSMKTIDGVNAMLSGLGTPESIIVDKLVGGVDLMVDGTMELIIAGMAITDPLAVSMSIAGGPGGIDDKMKQMRKWKNENMKDPFGYFMSTGATETPWGEAVMQDWLWGDLLSLTENLPAIVTSLMTGGLVGGSKLAVTTAGMLPFSLYHTGALMDEIESDPELAKLPEWKKYAVILPTVGVVSLLETVGVQSIAKGKGGIVNAFAMELFKKAPKNATRAELLVLTKQQLDSWVGRGIVKIVHGKLVEGTTEGAQQLVEIGFKETFDYFENSDKNVWKTSADDGAAAIALDTWRAIRAGIIMGGTMATGSHVYKGNQTYSFGANTNDAAFLYTRVLLENKSSLRALEAELEGKFQAGKLTKKQLDEEKRALSVAGGIFKQIDKNAHVVDQKIAYDLTLEKNALEKTIDKKGKDNAAWEVERVKQIKEELSAISIYAKNNSVQTGDLTNLTDVLTGKEKSSLSAQQKEIVQNIIEGKDILGGQIDFTAIGGLTDQLTKIETQLKKDGKAGAAEDIVALKSVVNNIASDRTVHFNQDMDSKIIQNIISQQGQVGAMIYGTTYMVDDGIVSAREFEALLQSKEFRDDLISGKSSYSVWNAPQQMLDKIEISGLPTVESKIEKGVAMAEEVVPSGKISPYGTSEEFYTAAQEAEIEISQEDIDKGTGPTALITPTGEILIDKARAANVSDVGAVGHEILHRLVDAKFELPTFETWQKLNPKKDKKNYLIEKNKLQKEKNKTISRFKDILQKRSPEAYKTIENRIKKAYVDTKTLTEEEAEFSDEWVTGFFDEVVNGRIKFEENLFLRVGDWLANIFTGAGFSNLNFKSGRQVYNFAKDFGKEFKKGELGKKTKKAITKAFEKDIVGEGKFSKQVSESNKAIAERNTLIEERIIEAGDVRVRDIKNADLQQQIKDELYENNKKAAEVLAGRAAKSAGAMALEKSKRVSEAEFKSGYNEQLSRLIDTYKPVVNGKRIPFGAYMQKNLKRRYGQILQQAKQGKFEGKEQRIGEAVGEGQREFDIASTDPTPEERLISKESQDKKDKVTPRAKLVRDFPEIFDQELKEDFETAGLEIFEGETPEVEGKEFKGFTTEAFRGKTTAKVKKKLGTGKRYEFNVKKLASKLKENLPIQWFVRMEGSTPVNQKKFTSPPTRLTKQEDIDKAMLDDKVYVEVTSQGVNTYEFKDFTAKELEDFILAPLVHPITGKDSGTRGTRKTGLAEGLVDLFGRQVSPTAIKKVKKEGVKEKLPQISKKLQVDPRTKFTNALQQSVLENAVNESLYYDLKTEISNWEKLIKEFSDGRVYDFNDRNPKSKNGIEAWKKEVLPKLVKAFPKSFFFSNAGTFAGAKKAGKYVFPFFDEINSDHKSEFFKYMNDNFGGEGQFQYAPDNELIDAAMKRVGQRTQKFNKEFGTPEFNKRNEDKEQGMFEIAKIFQQLMQVDKGRVKDLMKEDPSMKLKEAESQALRESKEMVAGIGALLSSTSAVQSHFMRKMAPVIFRQVGIKGPIREEHALSASLVAKQMFFLASQNLVDDNFSGIMLNYFQGPLSKTNDDKITALGLRDRPTMRDYYDVLMGGTLGWARYAAVPDLNLNTIEIIDENGKVVRLTKYFNVDIKGKSPGKYTIEEIAMQNKLIVEISQGKISKKIARKMMDDGIGIAKSTEKARPKNSKNIEKSRVVKPSRSVTNSELIREMEIMDKALNIARDPNAPVKKIRVFDFDDTLAQTKSKVFYTMPNGKKGSLTAEQFADRGTELKEQGAEFDFSDFDKVVKGKKGPLFEVAKIIAEKRGTENLFVLTARGPNSAIAIKEFLDGVGLNIPLKNITGLGDSSPLAKSSWIVDKAAEGYNDFYFADDHTGNVNAVKKVLSVIDVKSKVQQAKVKFSKNIDQTFNDIIEQKTGIEAFKEYSSAKAQTIGAKKGKFKFFIPPSAEDFVGLLYPLLGKGKLGDAHMAFFKEHLLNPFARGMESVSNDRVQLMNDFRALKKELVKSGAIPKNLKKKAIDNFTQEDIVRVMAWDQQGIEIEGLSKADLAEFKKYMKDNPGLQLLVDQLISINKGDGYAYPGKNWLAGTITTDLIEGLNTNKRTKYLQQWQENVDLIFSEKNLNKLEAAFGSKYREALEDILRRMRTGKNRKSGGSRLENRLLDYVNNSIGTVMFLNMRSGVLQTISAINFLNWSFNNPLKAGQALANPKQYWSDFVKLINSDFLVDRRNGLRINVTESEIADATRGQANKPRAVINYLLKKGFLVTQIMDSFAIASGGATFYRNRIKDLMKKDPNMKLEEAEAQAFREFRELAEESQQSARPDRISQQQASGAGRVILAFANTPMQYNRIIKKATLDLINGRGDYKTNLSKIVYYGMIQNLIFTALQQALFAIWFGDDEEDEIKIEKYTRIGNSMIDNLLRGIGIGGQVVMTAKNLAQDVYMRYEKSQDPDATWFEKQPKYEESAWKLLEFSPPLSIKLKKLRSAAKEWQYNKWRHDKDPWSIEDPAYLSMAYVVSSITNIPLDRLVKKITNLRGVIEADQDWWKRAALLSGWQAWELESSGERTRRISKEKEIKFYMKAESNPGVYSKAEQVHMLKQHGLSDKEIKELSKEKDRVNAILDLQKDQDKIYRPPKSIKKYTKLKNDTTKEQQENMLLDLGYSKTEIKNLKYEDDRVNAIIDAKAGKKKKKKITSEKSNGLPTPSALPTPADLPQPNVW